MMDRCNYGHIAGVSTAPEAWEPLMSAYDKSGITQAIG